MRISNLLVALSIVASVTAQVNVKVNLNVKHKVGDVEKFDRQKFVNYHGTIEENYWHGNKIPNLIEDFLGKRDVRVGRNTGGIKYVLNDVVTEDPSRPGFANPASIEASGRNSIASYRLKTWSHPFERLDKQIICNQIFPFYPIGKKTNKGWAFSQADTEAEPFGTASGEFYGRYLATHFGNGGATGQPKPAFVEVVNEPLWDLITTVGNPWYPHNPCKVVQSLEKVSKFHSTVAKQVRKYNPGMKVGGYCAAFPDFDSDNFGRWHARDKKFIDLAGADMDFFTIHLYDFPCHGGKAKYRKGANVEATMDMLEQYSMIKLGEVKPLMISEYNAQTHDIDGRGWSGYSDWLKMKSTLSMMMQFMERADKINYAMPFFMLRNDWAVSGTTPEQQAKSVHGARMLRRENEPASYTGAFIYTDVIKMYDLLKDINGTRVDTYTDNQDIMVDAYVDGKKAYIMINNLDFKAISLDLSVFGMPANPTNIEVRHLFCDNRGNSGNPTLDIQHYTTLPETLTLKKEATYMIVYTYADDITIDESSEETKYYADKYLQVINGSAHTFNIDNVELADNGEAVLRVGVSRAHGKSLRPVVKVNGTNIAIPSNFRGDPQTDRDNYFGVLEIPVPYEVLQENNAVQVTFPANGGHISTVTMQVFNFSSDIRSAETSIESNEVDNNLFRLFPNPAEEYFSVAKPEDVQIENIKIYTTSGLLVSAQNIIDSNTMVSVAGFSSGIYFVELYSSVGKQVLPLMVE